MIKCRLKCPNCQSDFGQESRLLDHLTDVHGITDHLGLYLRINHSGIHPTCSCSDSCTEVLKWAGWKKGFTSKYVRGHNARVDSCWHDPEKQKQFVEKRLEGYATGRNVVWNSGLTKETSEVVAAASQKIAATLNEGYASGRLKDWRQIDTEKAKYAAEKISITKKTNKNNGIQNNIWNRGLTKESSSKVAQIAKQISKSYESREIGRRITSGDLDARIRACSNNLILISSLDDYRKRRVLKMTFRCTNCNSIQYKSLAMLEDTPVCFECHPKESKGQLELYEFVKQISPDVMLSDRSAISPKEIDVYVPSKKFGIEYNGLYWHSKDVEGDSKRSQAKHDLALKNGISLFHIFEDEWRAKRSIVENMIRHRLGTITVKVGARKCSVQQLTKNERSEFLNASHLEGDVPSTISWGLWYNKKLVSVLSLRRPVHNKYADSYEIARFCSSSDIVVPGALSKLLKHAITWVKSKGVSRLMTYVDSRLGNGESYKKAGFSIVSITAPRFWWTDNHDRYDRFSVKADSKNNITEKQAAQAKNVNRIYGCSNIVLELRL